MAGVLPALNWIGAGALSGTTPEGPVAVVTVAPARERPRVTLSLARPDGSLRPVIDINSLTEAVSWTCIENHGWDQSQIGIAQDERGRPTGMLADPIHADYFDVATLRVAGQVVFRGRVMDLDMPAFGIVRGLVILGESTGLHDDVYEGSGSDVTTGGAILLDALRQAAPDIEVLEFVDPGVAHTPDEFTNRTPGEIAQQLITEGGIYGGVRGVLWMLSVQDGGLRFVPRIPPARTTYTVPVDDMLAVRASARDWYGAVRASWTDTSGAAQTFESTSGDFAARFPGLTRRRPLALSPVTGTIAAQVALTWLSQHSGPSYSISIQRSFERGLELTTGGERPAYLVREGESVEIGGIGKTWISRVSVDGLSGSVQIECGPPVPGSLSELLGSVLEADQAIRRKVDPVSGART